MLYLLTNSLTINSTVSGFNTAYSLHLCIFTTSWCYINPVIIITYYNTTENIYMESSAVARKLCISVHIT